MALKEFSFERFVFSVSDRYSEVKEILGAEEDPSQDDSTSAEDVRRRWSEHLKQTLPPCPWTAIWRSNLINKATPDIVSDTSAELNHFVDVIQVNWLELTATLEVIGSEQRRNEIPLIELYGPVRLSEEDDTFDIDAAKRALDHFQFFITYIWMPWDEDDDEEGPGSDWIMQHLKNRFDAYKNYIENSSRDIYVKLNRLRKEYSESKEVMKRVRLNLEINESSDEEPQGEELIRLHELETRLERIKAEADIWENPILRAAFESARLLKKKSQHPWGKINCFVWPGGKFSEMSQFISTVSELSVFDTSAHTIICSSLQKAIDRSLPGDTIYLPPGVHSLTDLGDLKNGEFSIIGVDLVDTFIEIDDENLIESFPLTIRGGVATFENVSIHLQNSKTSGLILQNATAFLNNVHVSGFAVGVQVSPGAALVLRRCEIFDCQKGLIIERGGCLQAVDVNLVHNVVGIVLKDKAGDNIKLERVHCYNEKDIVIFTDNIDKSSDVDNLMSNSVITNSSLGDPTIVPME